MESRWDVILLLERNIKLWS